MRHLKVLHKYFWKYRTRFFLGIVFIVCSNYFRILSPQISGFVVDKVEQFIQLQNHLPVKANAHQKNYDGLVKIFIHAVDTRQLKFGDIIILSAVTLLILALFSGFFMFLMRQTIIVMSRYIEYDQKNEIFKHYQQLDTAFFKAHSTGDLMNRIAEDVSRVRMYVGPALMYFINLAATIGFSVFFMLRENWRLTLYVLAPLPILAVTIYLVNTVINKKSEKIQALLSDLTSTAQESYSGIRVIKSFVQEKAMLGFFNKNSEDYKKNAISLAKVEAIYFPSMALLIGLSTLLTIAIGSWYVVHQEHNVTAGTITEFVIYINMLTFPVSAIGWTASMIQRAAASQKRINEFLLTQPQIVDQPQATKTELKGDIQFNNVSFTYQNTGINALKNINLHIKQGEKVLIMGKTGSGKSTLVQLLLRMFDVNEGEISVGSKNIRDVKLQSLRRQISYVPQDVFLFSDTVENNIAFSKEEEHVAFSEIENAAKFASIDKEIRQFSQQYQTVVGERGVTLSGGQKQRISIARALLKTPEIIVFDDCLSAVDAKTENEIASNLYKFLEHKTAIIISHRIFSSFHFDKIFVLEEGVLMEEGTHEELLHASGFYAEMFRLQVSGNQEGEETLVHP